MGKNGWKILKKWKIGPIFHFCCILLPFFQFSIGANFPCFSHFCHAACFPLCKRPARLQTWTHTPRFRRAPLDPTQARRGMDCNFATHMVFLLACVRTHKQNTMEATLHGTNHAHLEMLHTPCSCKVQRPWRDWVCWEDKLCLVSCYDGVTFNFGGYWVSLMQTTQPDPQHLHRLARCTMGRSNFVIHARAFEHVIPKGSVARAAGEKETMTKTERYTGHAA